MGRLLPSSMSMKSLVAQSIYIRLTHTLGAFDLSCRMAIFWVLDSALGGDELCAATAFAEWECASSHSILPSKYVG